VGITLGLAEPAPRSFLGRGTDPSGNQGPTFWRRDTPPPVRGLGGYSPRAGREPPNSLCPTPGHPGGPRLEESNMQGVGRGAFFRRLGPPSEGGGRPIRKAVAEGILVRGLVHQEEGHVWARAVAHLRGRGQGGRGEREGIYTSLDYSRLGKSAWEGQDPHSTPLLPTQLSLLPIDLGHLAKQAWGGVTGCGLGHIWGWG